MTMSVLLGLDTLVSQAQARATSATALAGCSTA